MLVNLESVSVFQKNVYVITHEHFVWNYMW